MAESSLVNLPEAGIVSRRLFLLGAFGIGASAWAALTFGYTGDEKDVYLDYLLRSFQEQSSTRQERLEAVRSSLRTVDMINDPDNPARGTAFQIDESGIYITANHAAMHTTNEALNQARLVITNPDTGQVYQVTKAIKHTKADIAVLYSPTGKSPKPTPNLVLHADTLKDGERLQLVGFYFPHGEPQLVTRMGWVDRSIRVLGKKASKDPDITWVTSSRMAVRDLKPFGGTSGSPIIDVAGRVVGVESGAYPGRVNSVDEYEGAIITPLYSVRNLAEQPSYQY